jgi:sulfonate transport system substrate-binding protein
MQRRDWLLGSLAGGLSMALPAAWAQPAQGRGVPLTGVTLRVGTYKGLWRALLSASRLGGTAYKIEWHELNNGVLHMEAINADALDLGSGSEIPPLSAARQKANLSLVAVVREDLNNQVTLARKDLPIRSIADLKGRRVGYVRGTTAHYFLAKQLAEVGLGFSDITALNLTPSDGLSAFDRGDLDAWAIYGYNGQLARLRYGARVLKTGNGYLSGNFPVYANPKAVADPARHAAIADFLLRLRQAYRWANANYLAYAQAQSAETRVPVGDLVELWNNRSTDYDLRPTDARVIAGHQEVADTFVKLGVLDGPTVVAPLWDRSFDKVLQGAAPAALARAG